MNQRLNTFLWYWFPVVLYCGFIAYVSADPFPKKFFIFSLSDKVGHFLIYAGLGMLIFRALRQRPTPRHKLLKTLGYSMLLSTLYGLSDEVHQYFVPFRRAEWGDVLADMLGGSMGSLAYFVLISRLQTAASRYSWIDKLDRFL